MIRSDRWPVGGVIAVSFAVRDLLVRELRIRSHMRYSEDVETSRQRRSRIPRTLNVHETVRLGPSLAAALLNGWFEHPLGVLNTHVSRRIFHVSDYRIDRPRAGRRATVSPYHVG